MAPRFSVWNGVDINPAYQTMDDIAQACLDLVPTQVGKWDVEWLVKAGEGGSYQSQFDSHPLAVSGPDKLAELLAAGTGHSPPVWVTPYFVVRARPEWLADEIETIADCAAVTRRVVLNLEPGAPYYNGQTDPTWINENYIGPLWEAIEGKTDGGQGVELEIASIPRDIQVNELGGVDCFGAWAGGATSFSWECYCLIPFSQPEYSLCPDIALPRTNNYVGHPRQYKFHIPIVQKDDINNWASRYHRSLGMQVWHLDGNI